MPQYRKLHTRVIESLDFDAMPDDFTRLMWLMLPLVLCREGRGIDSPMWLRSKLFPLREDVTLDKIRDAFEWFAERGMVERYQANGGNYFFIPTWEIYQGNTTKEAPSPYPGPILKEDSHNSRVNPELVKSNSRAGKVDVEKYPSASASESTFESESESAFNGEIGEVGKLVAAFVETSKIPDFGMKPRDAQAGERMVKAGVLPEDVTTAVEELLGKDYNIVSLASVENASISAMAKRKGKRGRRDKRGTFADSQSDEARAKYAGWNK